MARAPVDAQVPNRERAVRHTRVLGAAHALMRAHVPGLALAIVRGRGLVRDLLGPAVVAAQTFEPTVAHEATVTEAEGTAQAHVKKQPPLLPPNSKDIINND